MYRFFNSVKEMLWRKSAPIASDNDEIKIISKTKKETPSFLETKESKLQKLSNEASRLKEKISKRTPTENLRYIDHLAAIELDCKHYENEEKIEVKKLEVLFTPREFLNFKKEFQAIAKSGNLTKAK